jgi:opacity protein-like surface antigen
MIYFLKRKNIMRKTISLLILASALLATPIFAKSTQIDARDIVIEEVEQYPFIGIMASYNDLLEDNIVMGFRFGMQNNVWRTMLTYEDNFDEFQTLMIQVDRTIVAGLFQGKGRIYLGLSGGIVDTNNDWMNALNINESDTETVNTAGYAIGGNVGMMFYISDQVDVSIEYRYLSVQDVDSFDRIKGFSVALHYFF